MTCRKRSVVTRNDGRRRSLQRRSPCERGACHYATAPVPRMCAMERETGRSQAVTLIDLCRDSRQLSLKATDNLRESFGAPVYLQDVDEYTRVRAVLVDRLGVTCLESSYVSGRSTTPKDITSRLTLDRVVAGVQNE